MTGGSESAAGDKDGGTALNAQVPVGWQRIAQDGAVSYISPSGTVLRSVDEVRVYLRTDGTCKCGLECPLVLNKVFNFDPAATVQPPGLQSGKVEEDMTKLCNHRRKVDAMAALRQSMQPPQISQPAHATGGVVCSVESRGSGDSADCTYTQPRHNQLKSCGINLSLTSPRSVLQNGSVSHISNSRPLEQNSPLKKPTSQTPVGTKQQRNPHPPLTQNFLQRTVHNPVALNNNSLSSCPSSSSSTVIGRGTPQGGGVRLPSPLSVCSSPSRTLESLRSPCSRLDGILQHYSNCGSTNISSSTNSTISTNQNNHQNTLSTHPNPGDKRNGATTSPLNSIQASNLLGKPLGQILSQQKSQQHVSSSFPASSLLSAAAKAQLANQKTQSQLNTSDTQSMLPHTGLDKDPQSKVLISTLNSNLHPTSARTQSLTTLLLPHSLSQNSPALADKTLRRKLQRRSPTVLSVLKETQLSQTAGDLSTPPLLISPTLSPSSPPIPVSDNHLPVAPSNTSFPNPASRLQELEESRKTGLCNSFSLSSPSSSQPLSALLQLLSMQSTQNVTQQPNSFAQALPSNRHTHLPPSSSRPVTPQAPQCDSQPTGQVHIHASQPQNPLPIREESNQLSLSQPFPLMGDETTTNLKTTSSDTILNLSQPHAAVQPDLSSSVLSAMSQMSSASCMSPHSEKGSGLKTTEMCPDNTLTYQINQPHQSNHSQAVESKGPVESLDHPDAEIRLLSGCEPDHSLSLSTDPTSDPTADPTGDPTVSLPLAEAFPFMTQEQLLQLLTSNAGLPSLLPPFLGSLPLGIWTNQSSTPGGPQPQSSSQAISGIMNQGSPLNILPSTLGAQSDLPLNLASPLNPPAPGVEGGEKTPGLQALLMASLLLGQNPAAMLPLPTLNLELPPNQQQVFTEGMSLEKTPALLDSVLMGPGLLEALQTLASPADGQSLLLSAPLTPPLPAFLSLNPALLAAALGQTEPLPNHTPPPALHSQGSLTSPSLVSTSMSCGPLEPPTGQEVCEPLAEQDKNTHTPHFLPSLLGPGVLGDLTALGSMNSLHSLLGAGPLLLPQGPSLSVPLTQNQTTLNPLTCLQLTMGSTLMAEKPVSLHETPPSQDELPSAQISQDPLLNPVQAPAQQRGGSAGSGAGLFDPYGSFMDTIYTSFLQVSERAESSSDSAPLSYPELPPILQQASAPPSLSPRRACSVHNLDLSRLGMETAQSPARGTPRHNEDPTTRSKPAGVVAPSDDPLQPAFMEEAKTDGSSKVCLYSNGISSGMEGRGENEEDDDVGRRQSGYLSPSERVVDDITSRDVEQERTEDMHTGARRGRKRKQSLQRGLDLLGGIDKIIEEPTTMETLSRPVRSTRGKRRRVMR